MTNKSVMIIAHRGARSLAPENTIEAFKKAIMLGVDAIEFDLNMTKDGEIIIFHDDTLVNLTDAKEVYPDKKSYSLCDFTLKEVEKLNLGKKWWSEINKLEAERTDYFKLLRDEDLYPYTTKEELNEYSVKKVSIPTLKSALDFFKDKKIHLFIELKSIPRFYPEFARRVANLMLEKRMAKNISFISFDHEILIELKKLLPSVKTGVLLSNRLANISKYIKKIAMADFYNAQGTILGLNSIFFKENKILPSFIDDIKKDKIPVFVWTINDAEEMKALIAAKVDGITTDYPQRLIKIFND